MYHRQLATSPTAETPPPSLVASLVERSPSCLQPYLRLTRVDRPIGSWLLYWPCAWSIALAGESGCLPDVRLLCLFGVGAFLMRGGGCIVNDLWDSDVDGKVARTATRPLASGQISKEIAILLVGLHGLAALPILLSLNTYSVWLGVASIVPVLIYPYMKRITNWPQLCLGIVFNWGAMLGYSAVRGYCDWSVVFPLYFGCICWTMIYDTVYGHQDKEDDALLGLKSTSLLFGSKTKPILSAFLFTMLSSLIVSGIQSQQTWPYYAATLISASLLSKQIYSVNLDNRQECGQMFRDSWGLGLLMFTGLIISTLLKHPAEEEKTERVAFDTPSV
ncbi:4-hydroxybenzoate polyprenyltransferase, mitochondrial-like [Corticium candelabrum]|uniref:4-hydroxybenzoate polyprenyltransferase, mitochondrial-like n=1 Tax=Corticium candelabrum TaxID=121492 RepID=UPI002E276E10|nr:4-hydroxybenzoate polyprenyltransferase, mitochondrial-like [Corticium candelabrum]